MPKFALYNHTKTAGTNYVFNAGTGSSTYYDFRYPTDGVFWFGSRVKHTDITDGLSSTLMVSEALMGAGKIVSNELPTDDLKRYYMSASCTATLPPDSPGTVPPLSDQVCGAMVGGMIWNGDRGISWAGGFGQRSLFNTHFGPNDHMHDCGLGGIGWFKVLSNHTMGVNIILGDGSLHFIKSHVNLNTWRGYRRGSAEAIGSYCGCHD